MTLFFASASVTLVFGGGTAFAAAAMPMALPQPRILRRVRCVRGDASSGAFAEMDSAENGQFLQARVYVGNYGFTSAEMVTIRCTVNGQTADISTIPTLGPGEISVAECSFQAPIDGTFMTVDAIVDGGEVIAERNETNKTKQTNHTKQTKHATQATRIQTT